MWSFPTNICPSCSFDRATYGFRSFTGKSVFSSDCKFCLCSFVQISDVSRGDPLAAWFLLKVDLGLGGVFKTSCCEAFWSLKLECFVTPYLSRGYAAR